MVSSIVRRVRPRSQVKRLRLSTFVPVIAVLALMFLSTSASANTIYTQGGAFNNGTTPAIRNQDFGSGTANWVVEAGYAQASSFYRTSPYSLYVYGGRVSLRQDLSTTTLNQLKGNFATFQFWFYDSNDVAKAQLAVNDQYYEPICHCYIGGWKYYESPWTGASKQSGSLAWGSVIARGWVSTMVTQAYVRIIIEDHTTSPYVSANIDDAAMTLYDGATGSASYGNAALTFSVWKVDAWPQNTLYRANYLSVGISGAATSKYRIISMQLRMELEPQYDDCIWIFCTRKTSQDGQLWVRSLAEGNDRNLAVNPADQQKATEAALDVVSIGVGFVMAVATDGLGSGASLAIGFVTDTGTTLLFNWLGESLNSFDTTAYGPGADYFTQVRWNYPSAGHGMAPAYVSKAGAGHDGLWVYRSGVSGYRLKFVADVTWGQPRSAIGGKGIPEFWLDQVGVTTLTGYIYP